MNKKIIVINGVAGSGKNTFVSYLKTLMPDLIEHSTIDTVKKMAWQYLGVDHCQDKTDEKRQLWHDLKKAWIKYNDGPLKEILSLQYWNYDRLLVVHCREPKEIRKIKNHFGDRCLTVLITRPGIDVPGNDADQGVLNCEYDHWIVNDGGFDDLEKSARFVWGELGKKETNPGHIFG